MVEAYETGDYNTKKLTKLIATTSGSILSETETILATSELTRLALISLNETLAELLTSIKILIKHHEALTGEIINEHDI